MQDPEPGNTLGNRYELISKIGEGAFATTWRAQDRRLQRIVAIKVLRPELARDKDFAARFTREAQTAASISSEHTVQIFDVGADGDRRWIAMEFVEGESLRDHIRRSGGSLPPGTVRAMCQQILRGLTAIHEGGVVHRDLKPENVLIGTDRIVRIADFGIAFDRDSPGMTSTGMTLGTAAYMAPEQARGERVSPATDIYALGVMLFEMLTGRLPFTTPTTVAMLLAHQTQLPPSIGSVRPNLANETVLDAVIQQALQKVPARRFQSARSMLSALDQTAPTPATTVPMQRPPIQPTVPMPVYSAPVQQPRQHVPPARTNWSAILGIVFLAALIAFGAWYAVTTGVFDSDPASEPTPTNVPSAKPTATPDDSDQPAIEPIDPTEVPVPTEIDEPTATDVPAPTDIPDSGPPTISQIETPVTQVLATPNP